MLSSPLHPVHTHTYITHTHSHTYHISHTHTNTHTQEAGPSTSSAPRASTRIAQNENNGPLSNVLCRSATTGEQVRMNCVSGASVCVCLIVPVKNALPSVTHTGAYQHTGSGCNRSCVRMIYDVNSIWSLPFDTQVPITTQDLVVMSYEQLRRELAGRDCSLLR